MNYVCQCELKLGKCMWPGQCEMDIKRHNGECMICQCSKFENMVCDICQSYKTNQQVTADHTAKMFNQSKLRKVIAGLSDYDPELYNQSRTQQEIKMTRKEAIEKFIYVYRGPYADQFVAGLEALGLIKFDEEKIMSEVIADARLFANTTQEFINRLNEQGYKIVKK